MRFGTGGQVVACHLTVYTIFLAVLIDVLVVYVSVFGLLPAGLACDRRIRARTPRGRSKYGCVKVKLFFTFINRALTLPILNFRHVARDRNFFDQSTESSFFEIFRTAHTILCFSDLFRFGKNSKEYLDMQFHEILFI